MHLKDYISQVSRGFFWVIFPLLVLNSCSSKPGAPDIPADAEQLNVTIEEPVYRDFAEIKQSGVLRMISSYSSGGYFLYRGIQVGFEYELVREFALENDLALEVIIPGQNESPYDLLNNGTGDLIAASYTITPERSQVVDFTRPYNLVNQIVVVSEQLGIEPESISDLKGIPITIRRNSSYYQSLIKLQEEGFDILIELAPEDMDTETLLFQVASGNYSATISDDNIYSSTSKYLTGLVKGPMIAERDEIAWAIRKNADDLETKMNQFLYQHFKFDEDRVPKRSEFLNVLRKKYYEESSQIADYFNPEYQSSNLGSISPYDSLFQVVAKEYNLDWVMLTAIAAQESKFDPYSSSWAGALGLMQVLPRFSDFPDDSLFDPEINAREGARIIADHMHHYAYMDSTNRWAFALATYNAGMGHIADARRLSIDQNENPNEWEPISESLLMLMQRKYYQDARYGFCRGIETVRYVNEIINRYNTYQAILALANSRTTHMPGIFGIKTFNTP